MKSTYGKTSDMGSFAILVRFADMVCDDEAAVLSIGEI